jgi:hypothetical protein
MSQNINGSGSISSSSQGIARSSPKFVAPAQQDKGKKATTSNKAQDLYFKKPSAFKNRDAVQKKISNRIEDQEWVKKLPHDKQLYVIFGFYFTKDMMALSREIAAKNAEYVDRF